MACGGEQGIAAIGQELRSLMPRAIRSPDGSFPANLGRLSRSKSTRRLGADPVI